jgi:hypothetical protein
VNNPAAMANTSSLTSSVTVTFLINGKTALTFLRMMPSTV